MTFGRYWGAVESTTAPFYLIGNSYQIKSPPGRIALRRIGIMSQKRPAAGGESCIAGFVTVRVRNSYQDSEK